MARKTIALFSVSAGTGHLRAAAALKTAASREFPLLDVVHVDLMTLVPPLFKKLYADSYLPLVERHPALWGYLYSQADKRKLDSALDRARVGIERLNLQKFKDALDALQPDAVICTHFLPAELFSRWKRRKTFTKPVWVVVTDFDVHMLWVQRRLSGYFVANDEVAWRLSDRVTDAVPIHVTGIPIMPSFGERCSRLECARELGIDPMTPTLLMMSGGAGIGGVQKLVKRLLQIDSEFQLMVLAGRNEKLLGELHRIASAYRGRMFPMGYTDTIERVMAASDIAITKSGGLTTAECLAAGLPIIVVSPIPGQEERNADFLLEEGVALKAYDGAGLEFRVKALLQNPTRLLEMREKALRIGKPHAAKNILKIVMEHL